MKTEGTVKLHQSVNQILWLRKKSYGVWNTDINHGAKMKPIYHCFS